MPNEPYPLPVTKGNINLNNWKVKYKNPDGSISTIFSMSFSDDSGLEILVPTFSSTGKKLTEDESINQYYATGKHLGKFKTADEANRFAVSLHEREAKKIKPNVKSKMKIKKVGP
jgi:hypothetical protein